MHRVCLFVALVAAGCGPPEDQPDADTTMGGLEVRWRGLGFGTPVGDAQVDSLRLSLRDVRAVGDAAPGDDRTYRDAVEIELHAGEERSIEFDTAPPGRYSVLALRIAPRQDGEYAWQLDGTVTIAGEDLNLEIEDGTSSPISLSLDGLDLAAGQTRVVHVTVDAAAVVSGVDWSGVPVSGSEVQLDESSPLMPGFRARLVAGVQVESID